MRGAAVVVGGLLLVGGAGLVVVADQQRELALEQARDQVARSQERRDAAREVNAHLAETLTDLRTRIAQQDRQLSDTTGFLE